MINPAFGFWQRYRYLPYIDCEIALARMPPPKQRPIGYSVVRTICNSKTDDPYTHKFPGNLVGVRVWRGDGWSNGDRCNRAAYEFYKSRER